MLLVHLSNKHVTFFSSSSRLVSGGLAMAYDCGTPRTFHLVFECVSQSCIQLTACKHMSRDMTKSTK